jgi:tripartite-type tricarboxylate transporter receptor subunit TctC
MLKTLAVLACLLAAAAGLSPAAKAQDPAQFYTGRTIAILMGTSPGGSYDIYGRLIATHLSRQITGTPNIIIEHMPGAGGAAAGNYIYGPGPQDGSKILLSHALPLMEKLEDSKAIRFESKKLQWLGAYDEIAQVMAIWHGTGARSIDDLKAKELVFGSMATNHLSYQWAMIAKAALRARFKVISGYTTGGALNLAMERGEIAGWSVAWESIAAGKQDWIAEKKVSIPLVFTLDRMKQLPDVPTLLELTAGPEREVVEFLANGTPIARAMALGPNVPADRVAALRKAFAAMMKDPEFLDEAKKRRLGIRFRTAEETQALVARIVDASPALVERVKKAVSPPR